MRNQAKPRKNRESSRCPCRGSAAGRRHAFPEGTVIECKDCGNRFKPAEPQGAAGKER